MSHDHDHDHSHDHDHPHAPQTDHDAGPMTAYEVLEEALRLLLIKKGVLTEAEIAAQIDMMDSRTPALGAKVIARAWSDTAFKQRLLADCRAALSEMNIDIGQVAEFKVVENTPATHNVIVCTLCSCYPKMLLGLPPAWYKSLSYRSRTVREPRKVLEEFGMAIPKNQEVRVHDSTADLRYIVLPMRPENTANWTEDRLASIVSRDCMIGTATPQVSASP